MMVRVRGAWIVLALLTVGLAAAVSLVGFAQPTTYGGVTFPLGDRSFADRVVSYRQASCVRCAFSNPSCDPWAPKLRAEPDAAPARVVTPAPSRSVSASARSTTAATSIIEFTDNRLTDVPGERPVHLHHERQGLPRRDQRGRGELHPHRGDEGLPRRASTSRRSSNPGRSSASSACPTCRQTRTRLAVQARAWTRSERWAWRNRRRRLRPSGP